MISLRNFTLDDSIEFQQKRRLHMPLEEIKAMFAQWEEKTHEGKYFEMFAIIKDEKIVGMISLYQHSASVISCGPEIFECYRKQGIAVEAMILAMDIAKNNNIKAQTKTVIAGGNNASQIHKASEGVRCLAVSVPCRYLHSPSCVVKKSDVIDVLNLLNKLIAEFAND